MKKITISLVHRSFCVGGLLLASLGTTAQKEANFWYFGQGAGVDFSSGSPVALTNGALSTAEGCATIADVNGNLLFYTDGITVWDKNHGVMPNGTGLNGDISSSQSALIVPKPGSTTVYYIFTADADGGANGIQYSEVDMSLNTGLGDVVTKNTPLLSQATEKLTAMRRSGSNNYWVATHEWGTNTFYVYPVTNTGVGTPVTTSIGIRHNTSKIQNTYGQMKFSPCGDKLGLACGYLDTVQVFDFNDVTGVVSNPLTLNYTDHVFGLEFSPNGSKLYVSCYDASGTLLQYDLSLANATAIKNSKVVLSTVTDIYGLQLANTGKIYSDVSYGIWLGVVNSPNTAGTGCNYNDFGVNVDPNNTGINSGLTLPGFVQSLLKESACDQVGIRGDDTELPPVTIGYGQQPGVFNLTMSRFDDLMTIEVRNMLGEQVHHQITKSSNHQINISEQPAGVYFLSVRIGENNYSYKVAKTH